MKHILLLCLALGLYGSPSILAGTPTWSADVACIIYSHCSTCHNPQSIAPTTFLSYSDVVPNKQAIKTYVSQGLMPPYLPNTNYQHYADMRTLTAQEVRTLIDWVDSGAPVGDTAQLLPPPTFSSSTFITHPDLTTQIPTFMVPQTGADLYQCFVLTAPLDSDRYIKTMEVIPGNRNAVHHVLVYQDTAYALVAKDSASPGPGYVNFGGTGSNTSKLIGGWVPGSGVDSMPTGMAIKMVKGSRIIVQIHYPVTAQGMIDSTRINIQYDTSSHLRNVTVFPILNHVISMTDGPLFIPQDSIKTFHEQSVISGDFTFLSIAPHAHLVCTQMSAFAVTPSNDTIPFIEIDHWDFHWQGSHSFQHPIKIPSGSTLHGIATYNNTYNNPEVPTPLRDVPLGEATTDEMMLFFFSYLPYQPGDEDIIVDTATHISHYMNCTSAFVNTGIAELNATNTFSIYPNPTQSVLNYQSDEKISRITISDISGQVIKEISFPVMSGQIQTGDISTGLYFIKVQNENGTAHTLRFVKD